MSVRTIDDIVSDISYVFWRLEKVLGPAADSIRRMGFRFWLLGRLNAPPVHAATVARLLSRPWPDDA